MDGWVKDVAVQVPALVVFAGSLGYIVKLFLHERKCTMDHIESISETCHKTSDRGYEVQDKMRESIDKMNEAVTHNSHVLLEVKMTLEHINGGR